jgi:hypothetical protein
MARRGAARTRRAELTAVATTPNPVLRILWRRRALVALGALLALALTVKASGGAGGPGTIATTNVLLDTPRKQLVDEASAGVETLGWRATVLAELVGTESAKGEIAAAVPVSPQLLTVVAPELNLPTIPASLPKAASEAAAEARGDYVLTTRTDGLLPLIKIRAQAPDGEQAARLAGAAVSYIETGSDLGPRPDPPRFEVTRVGPIKTRPMADDPELARAVAVGAIFFCLWCMAVFGFDAGLEWWRRSGRASMAPGRGPKPKRAGS